MAFRPILSGPAPGPPGFLRRVVRILVRLALAVILIWLGLILAYRWIMPPVTPLMLLRLPETGGIARQAVPLAEISRDLQRAVIASEDNRFCQHHGVDWNAVSDAVGEFEVGRRLRGASTITMQVARNLFLWPGGGILRKGLEVGLAYAIDALWSKRRIMEVYLNVIEWGQGVYGAEAASEAVFRKHARQLTRREAALMAAVLPNPRRWSPQHPSPYIAERAAIVTQRIDKLEGLYGCLR